jgi:hypothetical protein
MLSGVSLETCWVFKKLWNNKFYYKAASCWYFYWVIYDERIHEYQIYKGPIFFSKLSQYLSSWKKTSICVVTVICSHTEKVSAQRMLSDTNMWFEKDTHPAVIRTPQAGMSRMSLILKIIIKFNTSHTDDKKLEAKIEKRRFLIFYLFIRNSSCISTEGVLVTSLCDTSYYRPVKRAHWKSTGNHLFRVYLYYFSSPFHPFAYFFCTSSFSSELWSALHSDTRLNICTLDGTVPSIKLSPI